MNAQIQPLIEQIRWRRAADELPDRDVTVLIYTPTCQDKVWIGFHDGDSWVADNGCIYEGGEVMAWASMPQGMVVP